VWLQFEAYADAFFSDLDVDGSRTLDMEEFITFYKKCLASEDVKRRYAEKTVKKLARSSKKIAKQLFTKYDVDNSGTIDVDELEAVLKSLLDLKLGDDQWKVPCPEAHAFLHTHAL
jgi:Ca2+-binding EF-hand superfamily protein